MKNLLMAIAILFLAKANAQQIKEGMIRYSMEFESISTRTKKPVTEVSETITYFKNGKSLTETTNKFSKMKILIDEKGVLMLMDALPGGYKVYSIKTKAELNRIRGEKTKSRFQNSKVTTTKEKKRIMGYECSQALLFYRDPKGNDNLFTIWYTEKIKNFQTPHTDGIVNPDMLAQLKGTPLEIDMIQGKTKSKMIVKEISTKPIRDAVFALSTVGYTEMKAKPIVSPIK